MTIAGILCAISLASCSGRLAPPVVVQEQTFSNGVRVETGDGVYVLASAERISIKEAPGHIRMVAVGAPNLEWWHVASDVRRITRFTSGRSTDVALSDVPLTTPKPTFVSRTSGCSDEPLVGDVRSACSGGSDCSVMDGGCVNSAGDCVYSSPCGNYPNPDGSPGGVGKGRISFPIDGLICDVTFGSTDDFDCYFGGTGRGNGPLDLYVPGSFQHNAEEVSMQCDAGKIEPPAAGLAYLHYFDGHGIGVTTVPWETAGGIFTLSYPYDFPIFLNQPGVPPPNPVSTPVDMSSNWYQYGIPLYAFKKGYCDHSG
ncbi:MAG TPA: hypothetical protein VIG46_10045 [Candidatus Baltobacteraceae bacterium]